MLLRSVKNKPNVLIVQKASCFGLKCNSTKDTTSSIRKMMNKYRTSASPLLEPSVEMIDESNRNEQAVLEQWYMQEEILLEVREEETLSTFQNIFSYQADESPFSSFEDATAPESTEDPVIIRDGTPYSHSGRNILNSDTVCHFSLPSACSEDQVVPNISSTADGNSSKFSPTGSRAKMLVNIFLREMSWSEPPPRVSVSSESDFDEDTFAKLNGNSNGKRCWGKGRANFKRLRISSDPEYVKRRRAFELRKKHDNEDHFQGIASLDDTTRQLLEVDIIKPLFMFQPTSGQ